jgi:hypothetical protein
MILVPYSFAADLPNLVEIQELIMAERKEGWLQLRNGFLVASR